MYGVAEPDADGGDVDGSAEHVVALVGAGGDRSAALELVDRPLGFGLRERLLGRDDVAGILVKDRDGNRDAEPDRIVIVSWKWRQPA